MTVFNIRNGLEEAEKSLGMSINRWRVWDLRMVSYVDIDRFDNREAANKEKSLTTMSSPKIKVAHSMIDASRQDTTASQEDMRNFT